MSPNPGFPPLLVPIYPTPLEKNCSLFSPRLAPQLLLPPEALLLALLTWLFPLPISLLSAPTPQMRPSPSHLYLPPLLPPVYLSPPPSQPPPFPPCLSSSRHLSLCSRGDMTSRASKSHISTKSYLRPAEGCVHPDMQALSLTHTGANTDTRRCRQTGQMQTQMQMLLRRHRDVGHVTEDMAMEVHTPYTPSDACT